jgi:hypothetical protein
VPETLFYDIERDVWARFEADGTVTLGMTDPAQTRCSKVVSIRFKALPAADRRAQDQLLPLRRGERWLELRDTNCPTTSGTTRASTSGSGLSAGGRTGS